MVVMFQPYYCSLGLDIKGAMMSQNLKKIPIELNRCKYCGSYAITIDDFGECPNGCPGYMTVIKKFNCDLPEKMYLVVKE